MRAPLEREILPARTVGGQRLSLLLIEDDRGDALLVEELIADVAGDIGFAWAQSMAEAERQLLSARPDCVLLDLNLPDANGIAALERIRNADPDLPIVVLTGLSDEHFGVSAVASGAQDYLVKGRVEPEMLRRAVLYAIERKRAEVTAVELQASQLRAMENARLERGLSPSPLLLDNPGVEIIARYEPSRENALLGGDLRIAWRALTFAGLRGPDRMRELERILVTERASKGIFATVLSLAIPPEGSQFRAVRAGHPGMLLHGGGTVRWLEPPGGPALGLNAGDWEYHQVEWPQDTGLVLLTD